MAAVSYLDRFIESVHASFRFDDDDNAATVACIVANVVWHGSRWPVSDIERCWFVQDGMSLVKIIDMADFLLTTDQQGAGDAHG
jgi:hypothetical protein